MSDQKPEKKQRIFNCNNENSSEDLEDKKIECKLLKLIDNIKLFESNNEEDRIESIKYFNSYHKKKAPEFYNLEHYIHFIVNNDMMYSLYPCETTFTELGLLSIKDFEEVALEKIKKNKINNNNNNDHNHNKNNDNNNNNNNNIESNVNDTIDNNKASINHLPDFIIKIIINELFKFSFVDSDYKVIDIRKMIYLGLISKRFFKQLSDLMDNNYYEWNHSPIKTYYNKSNLNKHPPLFFRYGSLSLIPYFETSRKELGYYFSRIETFVIDSNEVSIDGSKQIPSFYKKCDDNGVFVYPPPMPSLKNIYIYGFLGVSNGLIDLFNFIFKKSKSTNLIHKNNNIDNPIVNNNSDQNSNQNNNQNIKNNNINDNNEIGGIEKISIDIWSKNLNKTYTTLLFKYLFDIIKQIQINMQLAKTKEVLDIIIFFNQYGQLLNHISINFAIDSSNLKEWYDNNNKNMDPDQNNSILKFLNNQK
ncbi:hypothetical protein DICPUDRAFT_154919 [Dictyostelium purpureum]|uniref:F-box domain-containing protein n=1 Tax=Dictyostelium purpureum TaxID=5786 RepID=F0ZSL3_DICPU|nr:uncharacterized protein DICPUDRAFT_154919 [Dictyostelium purpureum]EGC33068.1 hypothetical protein DICPUDRAFT_154919 [Dictyostelium purpureum]|eukprot:XP_003290418.1 hypothetical protein DICPUDRAFT_154919 [Dictyostelium purpureum]